MRHTQCLFYALDQWHAHGGYLMLRRSKHWCVPHVLHMSRDGVLTHFTPSGDLAWPVSALCGFEGDVRMHDATAAQPMGVICMGVGAVLLVVLGVVWGVRVGCRAVAQALRRFWPIPGP